MDKNLGLGKGLSVLMGEEDIISSNIPKTTSLENQGILMLDIFNLEPSPFQPRRIFEENSLIDLVESIKEKGVLQPLLVRKSSRTPEKYEIIAGERRFRASQQAGLSKVPVIVKDFDDKATLEVALIENLQRENLNPFEEAQGYLRLLEEFSYTQENLAKVVGKSRSYVANMMRLLDLSDDIKHLVERKEISVGHARALLGAKNPEEIARQILDKGLNVRQTEKLILKENQGKTKDFNDISVLKEKKSKKDGDIMALETELSNILKTEVNIKWSGKGGEVVIKYDSLDKLDIILQRLTAEGIVEN